MRSPDTTVQRHALRLCAFGALVVIALGARAETSDVNQQVIVVPQEQFPDVLAIGYGWPASMTNGCLDRHECELPPPGPKLFSPPAPAASGPVQQASTPAQGSAPATGGTTAAGAPNPGPGKTPPGNTKVTIHY